MKRFGVKSALAFVIYAAALFVPAGTLAWEFGWLYLALVAVNQVIAAALLRRHSPDLLEERSKLQSGTKKWDLWLAPIIAILGPLGTNIAAGLQHRWGSTAAPLSVRIAGVIVAVAGSAVVIRSMLANRFFASTVRIQTDRGHRVCDGGPYAIVRHPGYVGILLFQAGAPAILGSSWAAVVALCVCIALLARTALEDATLQRELNGYADYASRVRYRLLPHVW